MMKTSRANEESNTQVVTLTKPGMPCKQQHQIWEKSNNVTDMATPKLEQQTKHQEHHMNANTKIKATMTGLLHKE